MGIGVHELVLVLRRAGHPLAAIDYMQVFEDHKTISGDEHALGPRDLHRAHVKQVVMYHMAWVARVKFTWNHGTSFSASTDIGKVLTKHPFGN